MKTIRTTSTRKNPIVIIVVKAVSGGAVVLAGLIGNVVTVVLKGSVVKVVSGGAVVSAGLVGNVVTVVLKGNVGKAVSNAAAVLKVNVMTEASGKRNFSFQEVRSPHPFIQS